MVISLERGAYCLHIVELMPGCPGKGSSVVVGGSSSVAVTE